MFTFNFHQFKRRMLVFLAVFGPATITAMADNDAAGVATYSLGGATLGYPILFLLLANTVLLALTQEMGMRLAIVTRKGLGDLIREQFGIRVAVFIFSALAIANLGTIIVDLAAVKTMASMFHIPAIPAMLAVIAITFLFVVRGGYRSTQNIMLFSALFYVTYIISAVRTRPDWGLAVSNLVFPHGMAVTADYIKQYVIIGLGMLGTTITPWGQFFISSFAYDKQIDVAKLKYSQIETYAGAILTSFFTFFIIVATAATLFTHGIPLVSGEDAAIAIRPFAGNLAGILFAVGILNAGFMGIVIVAPSTAYAFSEFFGFSGSLDVSFTKSRTFYLLYIGQLVLAFFIIVATGVSLFQLAVATQVLNALMLPFIFYYLLKLTDKRTLMGKYKNNALQRYAVIIAAIFISLASLFVLAATFFK